LVFTIGVSAVDLNDLVHMYNPVGHKKHLAQRQADRIRARRGRWTVHGPRQTDIACALLPSRCD